MKKKINYVFTIVYILIILSCFIKLPYYVNFPGGLINVNDKITINGNKKLSSSINITYVSQAQANLPILIYAYFNKNYEILKKNDLKYDDETLKEAELRDKIYIKEAVNNAIYVAYTKALKDIEITKNNYFVSYSVNKDSELKVGDQIIKVNDVDILNNEDISNVLNSTNDSYVNVTVIHNEKEYTRKVKIFVKNNVKYLGVTIINIINYKVADDIKINISSNESGPSGGAMFALAIYCNLIDTDITSNLTIAGTGTIDLNGNIGPVGGIEFKLKGAKKADIFFVPSGENYEEAIKIKKENKLEIEIIEVKTFDEIINILKNYK